MSERKSPTEMAKDRERSRRWRLANPEKAAAYQREWTAAHPGKRAEYNRTWRLRHLEERRAANTKWNEAHREWYVVYGREWRAENPHKARESQARRRITKLHVAGVERVDSAVCALCQRALTIKRWPHPLSTTIGHEPPLIRAARRIVLERPEHLACNRRKGAKLDSELDWISHE